MLLLIEPPGKKHQNVSAAGHRSAQLITYGTVEEDELESDAMNATGETFLTQVCFRFCPGIFY